MTRRAVEAFLKPAPPLSEDQNDDAHPFNAGVIFASVGNLTVYTFVDSPGEYWLDLFKRKRASAAEALAAFGPEAVARHRKEGEALEQDRRIDAAIAEVASVKTPEQEKAEQLAEWKRQADKAVRQMNAKAQAAADKMITRDLDREAPPA